MALPGRKPKPPHLRAIEGNPGHRPIPDAPKAPPKAPKQPRWALIFPAPPIPEPLPEGDEGAQERELEIAEVLALGEEARRQQRDAAAEWRRVVPVLDRMGLLATLDAALITDYCACWARLLQCERALARQGLTVQGQKGTVRNPHTTVAAQYRTALRAYIGELGLGPSSRGRLALPGGIGAEEGSPWDA